MIETVNISTFLESEFLNQIKYFSKERCGLLLGKISESTAVLQNFCIIENIARKTDVHYIMEPQQMINILGGTSLINKKSSVDFCGIFHTHPTHPPIPSSVDKAYAQMALYNVVYIIMGMVKEKEYQLKAYFWNDNEFKPIQIKIA